MMSERFGHRPVIFGEVLFDRFPDGSTVLGGAPFNVAWNLQALGQAPLLISRIGQDDLGERIRTVMTDWSMDTSALQVDARHATGSVSVTFKEGEPAYDIVVGSAYDFIEFDNHPALNDAAILYHGSLATRNEVSRRSLQSLIERLSAPRFVDVNLRAPWWKQQEVLDLLVGAAWVKLNDKELELLAGVSPAAEHAGKVLRDGYGWDGLILTRGSLGAEFLGAEACFSVAPASATSVVDTVGAGDAFASIILLGLLRRWPLVTAFERAQTFASAVVGLRGATVTDASFYAGFAKEWCL